VYRKDGVKRGKVRRKEKQSGVGTTHRQLGKACRIWRGGKGGCLGGWRIKVPPVAGTVRGHSSRIRDPWTHTRTISPSSLTSSDHYHSYSSRSSSFLQLGFFITRPPPEVDTHAPSLSQRDISAVTISSDKGSDKPHQSLR